jgi:hexosaminidase
MTNAQVSGIKIPLIPSPVKLQTGSGTFAIHAALKIVFEDDKIAGDAELFNNYLFNMYGFRLGIIRSTKEKKHQINIFVSNEKDSDDYSLSIDSAGILIQCGKGAGAFYAFQTLIELLPAGKVKDITIPVLTIEDSPRFSYRGMHLDVARHFFPVSSVKKYIDYLAMYKMNTFHWHLTDDQGWRIEIKRYPGLQKISAYRKGTLIGHAGDQPERYDTITYGGYYSQQEIKDVINYASARHITIIPEIEMPGHALAALAAFPELSCTGGPFNVGTTWGVFKDVFCPKEETFVFLQNVLDEVCALFPGKYIHIGGDECPKDRWKNCPVCQEKIKTENLVDENGLQRYFMNRIVAYLKTKNKKAIGWDEILDKGLDSDAVIMSWRGYNGGSEAAIKGHEVIMSPVSNCYLDMYQSRNTEGRIAIGGYLPVEKVYSFEPVPDVLNAFQAEKIKGAQGNVWTEYIPDDKRLQEMIFPRICAMSEVLWSPRESRDYESFTSRLVNHFKLLSFLQINFSTALYDISSRVFPYENKGITIDLFSNYPRGKIYYTLNGTTPTLSSDLYSGKIIADQSVVVHAILYEGVEKRGNEFAQSFFVNKATGKEIILTNQPHVEYSRGGAFSLVNGVTGPLPWVPSDWLGFLGKDLEATIDLTAVQIISRVSIDVLKDEEGKIFLPKEVSVLTSENGIDFILAGKLDALSIDKMGRLLKLTIQNVKARWVKVIAKNSNDKDWLFVDEIGIE